ncbi:hypothetical protein BDV98DRAFT_564663 [Pterulicium gracile]|uniref:Secreted protein n=1 Tax=Pterulicium gracile TaxID=1884261 RepID=A0A5C3QT72_9AGAR|nr:hypothetical protein BDV98DRAFT_564663 [Pterula gracilis]
MNFKLTSLLVLAAASTSASVRIPPMADRSPDVAHIASSPLLGCLLLPVRLDPAQLFVLLLFLRQVRPLSTSFQPWSPSHALFQSDRLLRLREYILLVS